MKQRVFAAFFLGVCLAAPASALEHEVVIDHSVGPIDADYEGEVEITTRQVGSLRVAGRPSTLRCEWTASLSVERTAKLGTTFQTRREMSRDNVARGSRPGVCGTQAKMIDAQVEARRETFRSAMLELVEQDRAVILAEAESMAANTRES